MNVTIDCTVMVDEASVHDIFSSTLNFPAHYGRNLDALYDLLSTCPPTDLRLTNAGALNRMFRYGENLKLTLEDAAQANPELTLIFED